MMMKTKSLTLFILLSITAILFSCGKNSKASKGDGQPAVMVKSKQLNDNSSFTMSNGERCTITADAVIDYLAGAIAPDDEVVFRWFGGEPLLAPEIVESLSQRLIALADERGIEYDAGIITNGYLLDQDTVDMLARCKVCALQTTQVSAASKPAQVKSLTVKLADKKKKKIKLSWKKAKAASK